MTIRILKSSLGFLSGTPLHPQWLMRGAHAEILKSLKQIGSGKTVVDIGCASQWVKAALQPGCHYIGLDYPETASQWYQTRPDVFCDASVLPVRAGVADAVVMLNVLEHLADVDPVLAEAKRILKDDGRLILQVPFLYPLHDEPRDYRRFTRHGLEAQLARQGLNLLECRASGSPVESAVLLGNIALSKTFLNWIHRRNPLAAGVIVLPFVVLAGNLFARLVAALGSRDEFMPYSYHVVAGRQPRSSS